MITQHTHQRRARRPSPTMVCVFMALASLSLAACNHPNSSEKMERELAKLRAEETADARAALDLVREGQRLEAKQKLDKALESYKQAALTYRDTPIAWNNIGRLSMQRGENMEAAEAFKTASELSPKDPAPLHNLGALWESMGWPDDALRYYGEALARDQDYLPSLRRSVLLDVHLGRVTDLTEARLRRALILEKDPKWRDLLLRTQIRLRDGSLDNAPRAYGTGSSPQHEPAPRSAMPSGLPPMPTGVPE